MEISNVFFEGKVIWAQLDANNHLRHSAYADFATQARLELLISMGFDANTLKELKIGPVLFKEELTYLAEIPPNDTVRVTCLLTKCRTDGSRWSFSQQIFRGDNQLAAQVNVDGAWINLESRKLASLQENIVAKFLSVPKAEGFILETPPQKNTNTNNMTTLEQDFEAAKEKVLTLPAKPDNETMLELYALNKQATVGDLNIEKPKMFDFVAQAKYNAWQSKKDMAKEVAQQQYIDLVTKLLNKNA